MARTHQRVYRVEVPRNPEAAILIGDPRQLSEIEAGGLFGTLVDRLPAAELHHNLRQDQDWEMTALDQLRRGSVGEGMAAYRKQGRLVLGESREATLGRAVDDWFRHVSVTEDLADSLLLARDHETVRDLNRLARDHLSRSGQLTGATLEAGGHDYQRGDRVICLRNDVGLGVLNGDLATVTFVDFSAGSITIRLDRGEVRSLSAEYLEQGCIVHGYALTGHKAQGITVDRTYSVVGSGTSREWAYVAISRGREANHVYVPCPHTHEQCTHVAHQKIGDSFEMAVSSLERTERQRPALEVGL